MKWAALTRVWFPLGLVALTAAGAVLLANPAFTTIDPRDLEFFWARHYWMSAFDALSAACGVGLLHGDINREFSEAGRWALTAIGLSGGLLYLLASGQLFRRLRTRAGLDAPPMMWILAAFVVVQMIAAVVVLIVQPVGGEGIGAASSVRTAVAAFASLGWVEHAPLGRPLWIVAAVSLLGAAGWPLWLIGSKRVRRLIPIRRLTVLLGVYVSSLALAALLIALFEAPRRGPLVPRVDTPQRVTRSFATRFGESLPRVAAASGAGMQMVRDPTTGRMPIPPQPPAEGSKLVLSGVVLVGGLGGGMGGGITWPLLLVALTGLGRSIKKGSRVQGSKDQTATSPSSPQILESSNPRLTHRRDADAPRRDADATSNAQILRVVTTFVVLMVLLTVVVATGLLLIESAAGSQFQSPPSLADALLDAASAVGGAGLTAGVCDAVTGSNLSSGINSPVDSYQFGTAWLMLAMLTGRLAPLWLLARLAPDQSGD